MSFMYCKGDSSNFSAPELFLMNFYVVDRSKTTYEHVHEVPYIIEKIIPIWFAMIFTEYVFYYVRHGKKLRLNDGITSISTGILMDMAKLFTGGVELVGYQWLFQYRLFDMDWQSTSTWWIVAIIADLAYYWLHRFAHEISLFWSGHQVHHSSEEYNMFTALRQSAFQHLFSLGIYQPLALIGVPLPALLIHIQFNLFFQFWIHTELISHLGPLEWIINTPSHHRVHHGANKYCLDKNYAGFLIIWDRMFGTFEAERKDEKITYGLVSQPQTFNPFYLQVFYFRDAFQKVFQMKTWSNVFKALFYGPGWTPGTPRLGDEDAIPEGTPIRKKWNPEIPNWMNYYLLMHFMVILYFQQQVIDKNFDELTWQSVILFITFVFYTLYVVGAIFNGYWLGTMMETLRCIGVTFYLKNYSQIITDPITNTVVMSYFAISAMIWCGCSFDIIVQSKKAYKNKYL